MISVGLSPNACNQHSESLLHTTCRHSKLELFQILMDFNVDVQQTDDYGRTPLHDACWAANPCFAIAKSLLQKDAAMMFIHDARGSVPLSYVTKKNWGMWNYFLMAIMDEIFPASASSDKKEEIPLLCTMEPDSRPVPDPANSLSAQVASQVASGEMEPDEVFLGCSKDEGCDDNEDDDNDSVSLLSDDDSSDNGDDVPDTVTLRKMLSNRDLNL